MTNDNDERATATGGDLRSFGRRRGRKPSDRQRRLLDDLLPRVAVDPALIQSGGRVEEQFGSVPREVWLEIGFGGGEHLLWQARAHPDVGLIGCEPFEDGVVKVLRAIEDEGLGNVRLLADDVRPLIRALPAASLQRVFILFPDPWPKKRHQKRRLLQPSLVAELARVIRPGGELRFATDIGDYARSGLLALCGNPDLEWLAAAPGDWRERTANWPPTRYEAKAGREGRRSYYFRFRRR